MTRKKKLEYIVDYYWYHILIAAIGLGLFILLIYHIGWGSRSKEFTCVLVNQEVDYARDQKLAEQFGAYAGIESEKILIDSDYQISYRDKQLESVKESSYEKFFFNWQAGEIDAMIIPESFYEFCLDLGGEFMEKMIPVRETKIKGTLAEEKDDPVYLMFAADTEHKSACELFENYLCDGVEE